MVSQSDYPLLRHTKHSPNDTSKSTQNVVWSKLIYTQCSSKVNNWNCFDFSWNEWVTLPHLFSELPRTAMLAITILDCAGAGQVTVIGSTTISLFGKNGVFRQVNDQLITFYPLDFGFWVNFTHFSWIKFSIRAISICVYGPMSKQMVTSRQQHREKEKIVRKIKCRD